MIPCLQPDSASERAEKKKLQVGMFHTPQVLLLGGSTSVLRAGYCTVPYLRNTMRALCELAVASMLTAFRT